MDKDGYIAIFDSGVGGLTVAKAISLKMPKENLLYFGDTANSPWGNKSHTEIIQRCCQIVEFLTTKPCKAIVIACNTASIATKDVQKLVSDMDVIDIASPIIENISTHYSDINLGVIGTSLTIKSNIYGKININNPTINLIQKETPSLAPLIEKGDLDTATLYLKDYLKSSSLSKADSLLLACTHYPLMIKKIRELVHNIPIINSSDIVAEAVFNKIHYKLNFCENVHNQYQFYLSSPSTFFNKCVEELFGNRGNAIKIHNISN